MAITKVSRNLLSTGIDDQSNATAITIDSSENVLVGKTATAFGTAGIEARSGGTLWATASETNAASFNRLSTDGVIAYFNKDGAAVGSIGTNAETMYVSAPQAGGMKYSFLTSTNAVMLPVTTTGANADATHDLGYDSARFRNLYLSGGVYLGGTGAANKLDDYEEGTFTPAFVITNCTVTHDIQQGNYTKVGNTVFFHLLIGTDAASGSFSGSNVLITGMPFATSRSQTGAVGVNHSWASELDDPSWTISSGTTTMAFFKADNAAGFVVGAQFATGGNSNRLDITGCYHTDS